jgi:hypothetical protein
MEPADARAEAGEVSDLAVFLVVFVIAAGLLAALWAD